MSNALTLSEILRRSVTVQWHEGVALVRSVTERILATPNQAPVIPELHQIELSPSGRVDIAGGSEVDEPIRRLGQLLQATLGQAQPPVQLRLVISQATAPTPGFASIREYDEALSYYERPEREAVLEGFYARAAAAPALPDAKDRPTLDAMAPLPSAERRPARAAKAKAPYTPQAKARRRRFAIAAVLLVAVGVGAVQYLRSSGAVEQASAAEVSALAAKASNKLGEAVVTGLSAVTDSVGLGRLVTDPADASPAIVPAPPPVTRTDVRLKSPGRVPPVAAPFAVFDLEPLPAGGGPSTVAPETPATPANGSSAEDLSPAVDSTIYPPGSEGVVPPVGIRPQLPRELPPHVNRADLASIELVVAMDGTVETVRLMGAPRNVHDSMWLSAIKAWQFDPAIKNGMPVRYRKTVWIAR